VLRPFNVEREMIMAKVLCVLYPDPVTGYPPKYVRDDIPVIKVYPNGQTPPSPRAARGFKPGELISCVSGELGLRPYLEGRIELDTNPVGRLLSFVSVPILHAY
jgi:hypothetical protein